MSFHHFVIACVAVAIVLGLLIVQRLFETPVRPPSYVAAFDKAFAPGFLVETRDTYKGETRIENVPFKVVDAGRLKLPSGQICAADPFVALSDTKPFTQQVPTGDFPVRLAVGEFPSGGSRVTFARVDFKTTPIGHAFIAIAALSLTAPAFAGDPKKEKGASEYAPGQTKPSDQSAKEYAPGQSEGAAKQSAPGQQMKNEDSTGSSSSGSSTGTGSSSGSTGAGGSRY